MKCYEQFLIYTKQIILTIITLIIYIDILSIISNIAITATPFSRSFQIATVNNFNRISSKIIQLDIRASSWFDKNVFT